MYSTTQSYFKIFNPFKPGSAWGLDFGALVLKKSKHITSVLLLASLVLAIFYVWEFNSVLNLNQKTAKLNANLKKSENEADKIAAAYSKIYATAISSYLEEKKTLERVSKIEYVEKKSLVEAVQYIP